MTKDNLQDIDRDISNLSFFYGDINFSYLLRNQIIANLRNKNNEGSKPVKIGSKLILKLVSYFLQYFPALVFIKKKYWVFSNAERRKKINDSYYDRVASIVSEFFQKRTLFIESPNLTNHRKQTKDSLLSESILIALSFLFGSLKFNSDKIKVDRDKISELEKKYDITINLKPIIKKTIGQYYALKFLLRFGKPKIVFMVYPLGYSGYIIAFKEKKIPVVELQHGVIYQSHPSYFCSLPDTDMFKPDFIFTYGGKDRETLIEINYLNPAAIIPTGSYVLWLYKNKKNTTTAYLSNILKNIDDSLIKVVVSCSVQDFNELSGFCKKVLNASSEYYFLILPRINSIEKEDKDYSQMRIMDVNLTNIYELIIQCDAHLTKTSTCALEALYFNKPSIVLQNKDESFFKKNYPFIKTLQHVNDVNSFIHLKETLTNEVNTHNIDDLFCKNIEPRFLNAMKHIERTKIDK